MNEKHFEKEQIENALGKNMFYSTCFKTSKGWLRKWSKVTGEDEDGLCSYWNCTHNAKTGVHLWIKGKPTKYYYIAPICLRCNNKEKSLKFCRMKSNQVYLKTNVNPNIHKGYKDENDSDSESDSTESDDSSSDYD